LLNSTSQASPANEQNIRLIHTNASTLNFETYTDAGARDSYAIVIDHDGKGAGSNSAHIGINKAAPTVSLDVEGNSKFAGNIECTGVLLSGQSEIKIGLASAAGGNYGVAVGQSTSAAGEKSVSLGYDSGASALGAIAIGDTAVASGTRAIAIGANVTAPIDECVIGDTNLNVLRTTTTNVCDLGSTGVRWKDGYFAGNLVVDGTVDGVDVSTISSTYVELAGDIMTGNLQVPFIGLGGTPGGRALSIYTSSGNGGIQFINSTTTDEWQFVHDTNSTYPHRIRFTHSNGAGGFPTFNFERTGLSGNSSCNIRPTTSGRWDLGTSGQKFQDGYFAGNLVVGGTVDGVDIDALSTANDTKTSNFYSAVNSISINNTTTETNFFSLSGQVGTTTIAAGSSKVGDVYRCKLSGTIATNGAQVFDWHPKFGGVWSATKSLTINEASNVLWELEFRAVIKTLGTVPTGVCRLTCSLRVYDSTFQTLNWVITNTHSVDTTAALTFEVTGKWTTAHASNIAQCQLATIEKFSS
jgi:hypothetical protein